jgi:MFS family permease
LRKNSIMIILGLGSAITLSMTTMVGPGFRPMSVYFKVSYDMLMMYMIGTVILLTGTFTFFTSAAAAVWGKRPVFLISSFILFICCIWGYFANTFTSLSIARAVTGIASAPLETLVTSSVYDMFFVHERGQKLAIWGVMLLGGMHVNSIIFSQIIGNSGPTVMIPGGAYMGHIIPPMPQRMGIKFAFLTCAFIWLFILALMYFYVPETVYQRPEQKVDHGSPTTSPNLSSQEGDKGPKEIFVIETTETNSSGFERGLANEPKRSRRDELRIFRGRVSNRHFRRAVWQPLPLICFPAVVFSTVVYGAFMAWLVILQSVQFNVLAKLPYRMKPQTLGIIGLPGMGAALIGQPFAGWLADWTIKFLSKRNKGVYEPEFRLWLMIPGCILSSLSFIGFGWAVENHKSAALIVTFSTIQTLSVPFASASSFLYVIDCHPENSNEAFVIINLFKSLIIFFASLKVSPLYILEKRILLTSDRLKDGMKRQEQSQSLILSLCSILVSHF